MEAEAERQKWIPAKQEVDRILQNADDLRQTEQLWIYLSKNKLVERYVRVSDGKTRLFMNYDAEEKEEGNIRGVYVLQDASEKVNNGVCYYAIFMSDLCTNCDCEPEEAVEMLKKFGTLYLKLKANIYAKADELCREVDELREELAS